MTNKELVARIAKMLMNDELEPETDSKGQIIFRTPYYENATDASIQETPDPDFDACHLDM